MRIRWAQAALADVESIGAYLEEHSPSLTESTILRLYEAAQSLKRFSSRGRIGRVVGTRELIVSPLPYIVVIWSLNQTCTSSECSTAHRTGRGRTRAIRSFKTRFPLCSASGAQPRTSHTLVLS
jgi:toxin ParE1/3/4